MQPHLNLTAAAGEIFGLVGPDGAGPSEASARLAGDDMPADAGIVLEP